MVINIPGPYSIQAKGFSIILQVMQELIGSFPTPFSSKVVLFMWSQLLS